MLTRFLKSFSTVSFPRVIINSFIVLPNIKHFLILQCTRSKYVSVNSFLDSGLPFCATDLFNQRHCCVVLSM
jgi:hypothetical protein